MTCTTGRRTVEDITGWGDRGGGERGGKRWDGRVAALLAAPTMNRPSSLCMRQYCMSVVSVVSGGEGWHDGHGAGVVFGCCGCAVIGQLQVSVWFGVAFGQPAAVTSIKRD